MLLVIALLFFQIGLEDPTVLSLLNPIVITTNFGIVTAVFGLSIVHYFLLSTASRNWKWKTRFLARTRIIEWSERSGILVRIRTRMPNFGPTTHGWPWHVWPYLKSPLLYLAELYAQIFFVFLERLAHWSSFNDSQLFCSWSQIPCASKRLFDDICCLHSCTFPFTFPM